MRFFFELPEGELVPWYLGLAYRRYDRNVTYFSVIPLHLFVRWGRIIWHSFRFPFTQFQSRVELIEQAAELRKVSRELRAANGALELACKDVARLSLALRRK